MTTHRFSPREVHHVDQIHTDALQAAVAGVALLRLAESAAGVDAPIPLWQIEEWAQQRLAAMRASVDASDSDSPDSEDTDGADSEPRDNPMNGTE